MARAFSQHLTRRAFSALSLAGLALAACSSFGSDAGGGPPSGEGGTDASAETSVTADACVGCTGADGGDGGGGDAAPLGPVQIAPLADAYRMAVAPNGNVWVTVHSAAGAVVSIDPAGGVTQHLTNLAFPNGIVTNGIFAYIAVEGDSVAVGASIRRHPLAGTDGMVTLSSADNVTDIAVSPTKVAWRVVSGAFPGPRFTTTDSSAAGVVGPPTLGETSPRGEGLAFGASSQLWFGVTLANGGQLRNVDSDYAAAVTLTPALTEPIVDIVTDADSVFVAVPSGVKRRANDLVAPGTALTQAATAPAAKLVGALADAGTTLLVATTDGHVYRMPKPGGALTEIAFVPSCAVTDLAVVASITYVLCSGPTGGLWRL